MSSRSSERYACDMRSYSAHYEKQLAALRAVQCSGCTRDCRTCRHNVKIKELLEDIKFCNGEVDRYTHEEQIAKRRKHYGNSRELCDTNIKKGVGLSNTYRGSRNSSGSVIWATKL